MLILPQYGPTCHPQILATCKTINKEASSILYGYNRIHIDVEERGVFAHHIRCGKYVPAQRSIKITTRAVDFTTIKWPDFISRCRAITFNVPKKNWRRRRPQHAALGSLIPDGLRKAALGNVVYSLCAMLRTKHHPQLDFRIGSRSAFSDSIEDLKTTFFPMRFIGFTVIAEQLCPSRAYFLFDESAENATQALRANDRKAKAALLREAVNILTEVSVDSRGSRVLNILGRVLAHVILMGARASGHADTDTGNNCYDADPKFTNTVKFAVQELRILLETTDISHKSKEVQEAIWSLLRLDIQLQVTPTAGPCERLPQNIHLGDKQRIAKRLQTALRRHLRDGCGTTETQDKTCLCSPDTWRRFGDSVST